MTNKIQAGPSEQPVVTKVRDEQIKTDAAAVRAGIVAGAETAKETAKNNSLYAARLKEHEGATGS